MVFSPLLFYSWSSRSVTYSQRQKRIIEFSVKLRMEQIPRKRDLNGIDVIKRWNGRNNWDKTFRCETKLKLQLIYSIYSVQQWWNSKGWIYLDCLKKLEDWTVYEAVHRYLITGSIGLWSLKKGRQPSVLCDCPSLMSGGCLKAVEWGQGPKESLIVLLSWEVRDRSGWGSYNLWDRVP